MKTPPTPEMMSRKTPIATSTDLKLRSLQLTVYSAGVLDERCRVSQSLLEEASARSPEVASVLLELAQVLLRKPS